MHLLAKYYLKGTTRRNLKTYIALLLFVIFVIVLIMINIFHTKGSLFADATQTSIGARVFWEYQSISPRNWYAWTESGVFTLALLGTLIYGITGSLLMTQSITPVIVMILLLITIWFLLKTLKFNNGEVIVGLFFMISMPWGMYPHSMSSIYYAAYSLTIITAFLQLAIYVKLISGRKNTLVYILLSLILAFVQGSNSSRATLVIYTPLFILDTFRYIMVVLKTKKLIHIKRLSIWLYCLGTLIVNYFATYMPWSVHTSMSKESGAHVSKLVHKIIPAIFEWIGLNTSTHPFAAIEIIVILLITLYVVIKALYHLDVDDVRQMSVGYFVCTVSLTVLMLTITRTDVTQRYFFMMPYLMALSLLIFLYQNNKHKWITSITFFVMVCYAIMNLWINFRPILMSEDRSYEKEKIIEWMDEKNYYYGYADYLDASPITVYSDGKVQISALDVSTMEIYKWVTDPKWYVPELPRKMKTVYIIRNDLEETFNKMRNENNYKVQEEIRTNNYVIYSSDYNYSINKE